jgi:hypothetical protein
MLLANAVRQEAQAMPATIISNAEQSLQKEIQPKEC